MKHRRIVGGLLLALVVAPCVGHFVVMDGIMDALCAAFAKDSPEWIAFGCFLL